MLHLALLNLMRFSWARCSPVSGGIPSLRHIDCTTQLGVIKGALDPTVDVTDESKEHHSQSCLFHALGLGNQKQLLLLYPLLSLCCAAAKVSQAQVHPLLSALSAASKVQQLSLTKALPA